MYTRPTVVFAEAPGRRALLDEIADYLPASVRVIHCYSLDDLLRTVEQADVDVVVLGVHLGGNQARAIEAIPLLRHISPATRVVVVTADAPTRAQVDELRDVGANAYVDGTAPRAASLLLRIVEQTLRAEPVASEVVFH